MIMDIIDHKIIEIKIRWYIFFKFKEKVSVTTIVRESLIIVYA